jgi:hypothetical protein
MGLINDKGECDFTKLRAEMPELFAINPAPGNAGAGNNNTTTGAQTMDQIIRGAIGR